MRTRFSGQRSSRAISVRRKEGFCDPVWIVTLVFRASAIDANGSNARCRHFWVR
jgi:hypothetical protein